MSHSISVLLFVWTVFSVKVCADPGQTGEHSCGAFESVSGSSQGHAGSTNHWDEGLRQPSAAELWSRPHHLLHRLQEEPLLHGVIPKTHFRCYPEALISVYITIVIYFLVTTGISVYVTIGLFTLELCKLWVNRILLSCAAFTPCYYHNYEITTRGVLFLSCSRPLTRNYAFL